jgi:hypothetical protein
MARRVPLGKPDEESPRISVRLARPKHDRVIALAGEKHVAVSDLIRDLVDRELERADMEPLASG